MTLTDEQLADLERLADAATPLAQRFMTDQMPPCEDYPTPFVAFRVGDEHRVVNLGTVGTATFAVAANPNTVKSLIADLREARASLDEARRLLEEALVTLDEVSNSPTDEALRVAIRRHLGKVG